MSRSRAALLAAFALLLGLGVSCGRGPARGPGSNAPGPGPQAMRPVGDAGGPARTPEGNSARSSGKTPTPAQPGLASPPRPILPPGPPLPSGPRYLNLQAPPLGLLPEDFSLGALEDLGASPASGGGAGSGQAAPRDLVASLSAFLDALVAGRSLGAETLPGRTALLGALLEGVPAQGSPGAPDSWRLGSVLAQGEEAEAPFALFAKPLDPRGGAKLPPRAEGLLHARLVEGRWYVEDVSLDPSALGRDRPLPDPAWEPRAPGAPSP